ncbi:MAG: D-aminoacylase [Verrucomicrobia bacterium]|nr:D-aminoacylase [Verrucomicrobiota bacterium]
MKTEAAFQIQTSDAPTATGARRSRRFNVRRPERVESFESATNTGRRSGVNAALRAALLLLLVLRASAAFAQTNPILSYDLAIFNARVVDGTGAPWYRADIVITDGRIEKITRLGPHGLVGGRGAREGKGIDAHDLIVAPGFIDMMGQTATPFLTNREAAVNLLSQGITTILTGEGESAAPLGDADAKKAGWRTMREYLALLDAKGMPMNVAQTVGHTQVRSIVIGDVDRAPTAAELAQMKSLVREAMEAGAVGASTALIYPPAVFAKTDEIAALCSVAGESGGRYYTHMRNEGDRLLEAIDEAIGIGEAARTPVHIFHLKTAGQANWGKMELALARIHAARAAGREVDSDVYPYINNGLDLEAFVHPRFFAGGQEKFRAQLKDAAVRADIRREMETGTGYENWFRHTGRDWDRVVVGRIGAKAYQKFNGQSIAAIAKATGRDAWEIFFDLLNDGGAFAMPQTMSEANKIKAMRAEFVSFCTDVGPAGGSTIASHPRAYGSFPRILSRYVRDLGVMSLEKAVAKMSAVAANQIFAHDRGRIAEGLAADLVIFDPDAITDRATFGQPTAPSEGIKFVIVNGTVVFADGKVTGALPGRVLRGPGYKGK